jgi:hypothetical protein
MNIKDGQIGNSVPRTPSDFAVDIVHIGIAAIYYLRVPEVRWLKLNAYETRPSKVSLMLYYACR